MSNSNEFIRWDIWLAEVKFEDIAQSKIRPVLIMDATYCYVISLKITSHPPRTESPGEYLIREWKESGLMKPSVVRISKRISLPQNSFVKKIGRLSPLDCSNILNIYRELYIE